MKKIVVIVMALVMALCGFTACGKTNDIVVYMPDGAPTLSMVSLMASDYKIADTTTKYKIVSSEYIGGYVANGQADLAVLPLNLASKVCTDKYQILSVMTFGNLYVVGKSGNSIDDIIGHNLSVINLNNVPGLTTRMMLQQQGIDYSLETQTTTNIKLIGATASEIIGGFSSSQIEYAVVAEPAVSKMLSLNLGLKVICDIQEVMGEYPQSVLVVKKGKFSNAQIETLCEKLASNATYLQENIDTIYDVISAHLENGVETAFQKSLLNADLINRCNVGFALASNEKSNINNYIARLKGIADDSANTLNEGVIYENSK